MQFICLQTLLSKSFDSFIGLEDLMLTQHRRRLFLYSWLGICIPSILLMTLGAAIGATVLVTPDWNDAYELNSIGGVMAAMLHPAGGFGRFVTLILALSVIANTAPSVYSLSLNFQILLPVLHIVSLEGFLGIISYWSAGFAGIQLTEWFFIRHMDPETYDVAIWDNPKLLPSGIPALVALVIPFAIVVPSMDQIWYVGPIAATTGDLGFEFALVLSPFIYYPLRMLEIKLFRGGRL